MRRASRDPQFRRRGGDFQGPELPGRNRGAYRVGNPRRGAPAASRAGLQCIRKLPLQLAFNGVGNWVMAGELVGRPACASAWLLGQQTLRLPVKNPVGAFRRSEQFGLLRGGELRGPGGETPARRASIPGCSSGGGVKSLQLQMERKVKEWNVCDRASKESTLRSHCFFVLSRLHSSTPPCFGGSIFTNEASNTLCFWPDEPPKETNKRREPSPSNSNRMMWSGATAKGSPRISEQHVRGKLQENGQLAGTAPTYGGSS